MAKSERRILRVLPKVLAASACLSVPALAIALLSGGSLSLLSGQACASGEFRVYDPPPAVQAKAVKPAQADEPAEVDLASWEQTFLKPSNSK